MTLSVQFNHGEEYVAEQLAIDSATASKRIRQHFNPSHSADVALIKELSAALITQIERVSNKRQYHLLEREPNLKERDLIRDSINRDRSRAIDYVESAAMYAVKAIT